MAGPWEDYQKASMGPWSDYAPKERTRLSPIDLAAKIKAGSGSNGSFHDAVRKQADEYRKEDAKPKQYNGPLKGVYEYGTAEGHHLASMLVGGGQLVHHGLTSLADLLPAGNSIRKSVDDANVAGDMYARDREMQYQASIPNSKAAIAGAAAGEIAPFMVEAPVKALQTIGGLVEKLGPKSIPLIRKILSGAAQGGTIAALQPVNSGPKKQVKLADLVAGSDSSAAPSFAEQKLKQVGVGALLGGGVPGAISATRSIGDAISHVTDPEKIAANNLARVLGANQNTLRDLSNVKRFFHGDNPTTAQVLGTPRAVMAEKAFNNTSYGKEASLGIQNENSAARIGILRSIAGDDASLEAAKNARKAATQPFIDRNLTPSRPGVRWRAASNHLDAAINNPAQMPSADFDALKSAQSIVGKVRSGALQEDDAVEDLKRLADAASTSKARGAFKGAMDAIDKNMVDPSGILKAIATTRNGSLGTNPTVNAALGAIEKQIKGAQNIRGLVGSDLIDGIRQNAGRILQANHSPNRLVGSQEEAGIAPVKDKITQTLERTVPGYRDYLASYAKHSEPINDMESAREILESVDNGALNSDGNPNLTLAKVNAALRKSDGARYGLSPKARDQLEGIRQSLQRDSISNSVRSPGSDTNYNLQAQGAIAPKLLGASLQGPGNAVKIGTGMLGVLVGGYEHGLPGAGAGAVIGGLLDKSASMVNQRIQQAYGNALAHPDAARMLLERYVFNPRPSPVKNFLSLLAQQRLGPASAVTANTYLTSPQNAQPTPVQP